MKKKALSIALIIAIIVCLIPMKTETASASYYNVDLHCYTNLSGAVINGTKPNQNGYVSRSVRRDGNLTSDFNNIKPTCNGYTFLGWYTAPTGGTKVTAENLVSLYTSSFPSQVGNMKIYAHWSRLAITSSGNGWVSAAGGSVSVFFNIIGGHNWYITSTAWLSGGTGWTSLSRSGSYITVNVQKNNGAHSRQAVVYIYDSTMGKTYSFTITQQGYSDYLSGVIKSTNDRFYNPVSAGGHVEYNFGQAALFGPPTNRSGKTWCTDSAMMDLLNRRLAVDGQLKAKSFFDIRDIMWGMAHSPSSRDAIAQTSVAQLQPGTADLNSAVTTTFTNGGEFCNPDYCNGSTTSFENVYGGWGNSTAIYEVKFEDYSVKSKVDRINGIVNLLNKHPEGVFVYANHNGTHAFLIVDYEKTSSGDYRFKYVDNSEARGSLSYSATWFCKGHAVGKEGTETYKSNNKKYYYTGLFDYITCVGYVNRKTK